MEQPKTSSVSTEKNESTPKSTELLLEDAEIKEIADKEADKIVNDIIDALASLAPSGDFKGLIKKEGTGEGTCLPCMLRKALSEEMKVLNQHEIKAMSDIITENVGRYTHGRFSGFVDDGVHSCLDIRVLTNMLASNIKEDIKNSLDVIKRNKR